MANQSKRVGAVGIRNGGTYECYEALVPIECDSCGETIHPGERFTRLMRIGGGHTRYPTCAECEPHFPYNTSPGNRDSTRHSDLQRHGL